MEQKKVVYIAGPITGVENYRELFQQAEEDLVASGFVALNPAMLPSGMTNAQYMRICLAMIDCADAILLMPGWAVSDGAALEKEYARYTGMPRASYRIKSPCGGHTMDAVERRAWMQVGLMEAIMWAPGQEGVLY